MTAVLVHGNPENAAVWDLLVDQLSAQGCGDPVRLSPPGFGAPVPAHWGATVEEYRAWLVAALEQIGEPVDLVGHDWGGGHVLNVVMTRPDLIRSWCSDTVGTFDPDYVWHDLAQVWQRPGDGEAWLASLLATSVDQRAASLSERGMASVVAARVATALDETMVACILRLYRSAAQPFMAELGATLERARLRPGLAIVASDDHMVGTEAQRHRAADRAGAQVQVLDGLGHWWMAQDPKQSAEVLMRFWAGITT